MNTCLTLLRRANHTAFGCLIRSLLLTSWLHAAAQEPVKPPVVIDRRPKNGMLVVVGFEIDKARADAILQKQDMTQDVKTVVEKLEALTQSKVVTHSSCAAQVIRSGTRSSLDMGASHLEIEGTIGASGDFVILIIQRRDNASGTGATIRANLKIGEYAFIGTVPDAKPGKDLLLFVRLLMHHP